MTQINAASVPAHPGSGEITQRKRAPCFTGAVRPSAEAVQLHAGALRGVEHREAIVEPQEAAEVAQFQDEGHQAHRQSDLQGDFRYCEREAAGS